MPWPVRWAIRPPAPSHVISSPHGSSKTQARGRRAMPTLPQARGELCSGDHGVNGSRTPSGTAPGARAATLAAGKALASRRACSLRLRYALCIDRRVQHSSHKAAVLRCAHCRLRSRPSRGATASKTRESISAPQAIAAATSLLSGVHVPCKSSALQQKATSLLSLGCARALQERQPSRPLSAEPRAS